MIKVSVIIAIYNVAEYLERCLDSLRVQTFSDFEVLCVNDGSRDNSKEIIEKYQKLDKRFILLDKTNGGLSDARNYGLKRAKGEYIMFVDGDDFVEPDFIKASYEKMIKDDLDLVVFDYNQYYLEKNSKEVYHLPFDDNKIYELKSSPELLAYCNNSAWNKMYKVSLFKENQIEYPLGYNHQDLGTTPKLLSLSKKVGFISVPLYNYLVDRPNNITTEKNPKIYHIIDMCKEFVTYYQNNRLFEIYYEELKYLCVINCLQSLKKLPYFSDTKFVAKFVNDCFNFIEDTFKDYPKCKYPIEVYKEDKIYLNKHLLRAYLLYCQKIKQKKR